MSADLDPITGKDPSTLPVAILAERLASERSLRLAFEEHIRELLDERRDAIDKALEKQAAAYERRLEALNGEAGRLAHVLADSIPREVFENYKETQAEAAQIVANTLAEERGARAGGQRLMAVMLFLFALAALVLKFIPVGT